jgi:hypothetical protein
MVNFRPGTDTGADRSGLNFGELRQAAKTETEREIKKLGQSLINRAKAENPLAAPDGLRRHFDERRHGRASLENPESDIAALNKTAPRWEEAERGEGRQSSRGDGS